MDSDQSILHHGHLQPLRSKEGLFWIPPFRRSKLGVHQGLSLFGSGTALVELPPLGGSPGFIIAVLSEMYEEDRAIIGAILFFLYEPFKSSCNAMLFLLLLMAVSFIMHFVVFANFIVM